MRGNLRIALFLVSALAILALFYTLISAFNTLNRLDVVEAARDRWQRPDEILRSLELREGYTVVDVGSGAGYFALKMAPIVGPRGKVLAVDLRRLSLTFLSIRAWRRGQRNVEITTGDAAASYLPPGTADAVLICNTYHEVTSPQSVLSEAYRALRPGGRLAVADRSPGESEQRGHGIAQAVVEAELNAAGFDVDHREEHLLTDPDGDSWWLLAARRRP